MSMLTKEGEVADIINFIFINDWGFIQKTGFGEGQHMNFVGGKNTPTRRAIFVCPPPHYVYLLGHLKKIREKKLKHLKKRYS